MAIEWDQFRKEIATGKDDWIGAAQSEYGEYLYQARQRFQNGEAATTRQVKALYRRVAGQLRTDIESISPGTLRRAHLTALAGSLEKAARTLNQEILDTVTAGIRLSVDDAVGGPEEVTRELLAGAFDPVEVKWLFADINERAVMSLLARTRHDGLKLSDRVWRISQHARTALQKVVEDGVTRGLDSRKLARQVQRYLQPDVWTALKSETRDNLGVPRAVSMEAMRLAVTEMNNAFHEGTVNAYRAIPSSLGIYWRLSASHPLRDICDDYAAHDGTGFWTKGEEPAKPHPWCRCVAVPAMEDPDKFTDRLRSWMQNPAAQPDLEMWYNNTARRFLKRPTALRVPGWGGLPGEPGDTGFVEVLVQNGISRTAARTIEQTGEEIRRMTVSAGVEHAAMIDAEDGARLGNILSGDKGSVDVGEHIQAMEQGRRYVQLHTHPKNSSFSDTDIVLLAQFDELRALVVFGTDGRRYVICKRAGATVATRKEIIITYSAERDALYNKYYKKVSSGEISSDEAWKEHSHEIWLNTAYDLGFDYIRIAN